MINIYDLLLFAVLPPCKIKRRSSAIVQDCELSETCDVPILEHDLNCNEQTTTRQTHEDPPYFHSIPSAQLLATRGEKGLERPTIRSPQHFRP